MDEKVEWKVKMSEKIEKCSCGRKAVGVIAMLIGHRYVCKTHVKEAEKEGWIVDYDNWRLGE